MSDTVEISPVDWRAFFDEHAARYDENPFTKHTLDEVLFFETLFPLAKGSRILDVGCGTGRHSIALAERGYAVTGVDFSSGMLAQAQRKADETGVSVDWVLSDARSFAASAPFDAAICLCEGGIGLLNADDDAETHDRQIFQTVAAALKPGGGFLLTSMNAYAIIRRMDDDAVRNGLFDPVSMLAKYADDWELPDGRKTVFVRERLFLPTETRAMLEASGFEVMSVYGGTAGAWGRRPLMLDEVEAMYVCRKR